MPFRSHTGSTSPLRTARETEREIEKGERDNFKWNYLSILWSNFRYKVRNDGVDIKKLTLIAPIKRNYVCARAGRARDTPREREKGR